MSRHLNFISLFRANRKSIFEEYEKNGGEYDGIKPTNPPAVSRDTKRSLELNELSDNGTDEDSVDQLFV